MCAQPKIVAVFFRLAVCICDSAKWHAERVHGLASNTDRQMGWHICVLRAWKWSDVLICLVCQSRATNKLFDLYAFLLHVPRRPSSPCRKPNGWLWICIRSIYPQFSAYAWCNLNLTGAAAKSGPQIWGNGGGGNKIEREREKKFVFPTWFTLSHTLNELKTNDNIYHLSYVFYSFLIRQSEHTNILLCHNIFFLVFCVKVVRLEFISLFSELEWFKWPNKCYSASEFMAKVNTSHVEHLSYMAEKVRRLRMFNGYRWASLLAPRTRPMFFSEFLYLNRIYFVCLFCVCITHTLAAWRHFRAEK